MVREGFILTPRETAELFLILSTSRLKLNGKIQTLSEKYWKKFEEALGLNPKSIDNTSSSVQDASCGGGE